MYANLCRKLRITLDNLKHDERGVTAIEYAILAAVVAITLGTAISTDWFQEIFNTMRTAITGAVPDA